MSFNEEEFQNRLARHRARIGEMGTVADELRRQFPNQPDVWYVQEASRLVQLENQNAVAAAQRRSWLNRLFG